MLLTEQDAIERMESPLNLMNRLRAISQNQTRAKIIDIPTIPPKSEELVEDLEDKISQASIRSRASQVLTKTLRKLDESIEAVDIDKPERLAKIAESMSRVVAAEKNKNDDDGKNRPQYIVYAPQIISEQHFETIVAKDDK